MQAVLELVSVTRRFPGVVALDAVDFALRPGEVHALVGENGAGKSTLINVVSGVLKPDGGEILLDGKPAKLTDPLAARAMGIRTVHQEADLFGPLSIAENMALSYGLPTGALGRVRWGKVYGDARRATARLGEPIDVRRPAATLSVAHRRLAQIAAALLDADRDNADRPETLKVLILDEPTSALTEGESEWLFEQIGRLRQRGTGVIYITHRQDEIFRLADRITVLRDGRRVWAGAASAIDRHGLIEAMVGRTESEPSADRTASAKTDSSVRPRLRVENLSDREGRFSDVSLDVRPGEIVGVYGLIGAGRSEWAQSVFGLRPISGGAIEIDGIRRNTRSPGDAVRAGLAYLPEDRLRQGLCRELSVRENAVLSCLANLTRGPFTSIERENAVTLGQADRLGVRMRDVAQPVGQLSGGNQQKVVFARWMLTEPGVLILDEPTQGIDVGAKAEIHRLLRQLADAGCAIVMISSELPEVMQYSDRVVVFRSGSVAGSFDPATSTAVDVARAALPDEGAAGAKRPERRARPRVSRLAWSELGLVAAIAILAAALTASTNRFLSTENLIAVVNNASVWTILALGSAAVIVAGGIDISIGSLLALSAGVAGLLLKAPLPEGVAFCLGICGGLVVGMAGGAVNAAASLVGRIHPIVVTLGTMTIYRGLLITLTGGDAITGLPDALTRLAVGRLLGIPGSVLVMGMAVLAAGYWLGHTANGRSLYAIGSSPSAARLAGISKKRAWLSAFAAGGLCAGLAGLLELAQTGSMQSVLGTGYELRAIAAAVIGGTAITGGRGSVVGVLLGALLLSLLQNALVLWEVAGYHYDLVIGSLLLAAILVDHGMRRLER